VDALATTTVAASRARRENAVIGRSRAARDEFHRMRPVVAYRMPAVSPRSGSPNHRRASRATERTATAASSAAGSRASGAGSEPATFAAPAMVQKRKGGFSA
jgi:hypothetical protein